MAFNLASARARVASFINPKNQERPTEWKQLTSKQKEEIFLQMEEVAVEVLIGIRIGSSDSPSYPASFPLGSDLRQIGLEYSNWVKWNCFGRYRGPEEH